MRAWFKKYFIPHQENEHKPHFLRKETMSMVLVAITLIEVGFLTQTFFIAPHSDFFATILNSVLVTETNNNRVSDFLTALTPNDALTRAAQMKADDMAAKHYFAHMSPGNITPWYWMEKAGYTYSFAGENLAINFTDSKDAVTAWMNSEKHRANILDARFTEIGIGIATGEYEGKETTFVVQMFGRPPAKAAETAPAATSTAVAPVVKSEASKTSSTLAVLGANTQNVDAVEIATTTVHAPSVTQKETTSTPTTTIIASSKNDSAVLQFTKETLSSPRRTINSIFIVLLILISVALALKVGIAIRIQHPHLIANGVLMIVVISSAIALNHYLVFSQMKLF